MTTISDHSNPGRRISRFLHARPRLRLGLLLSGPIGWLVVAYLGSLIALLVTSFYKIDDIGLVVKELSFSNFHDILTESIYRTVTIRTLAIAVSVTLIDVALALPTAFFMAKLAGRRQRTILVALVLVPLWSSYLVKAFAWRAMLGDPGGVLESTFGATPGFGLVAVIIVFAYLWLPYMILPIYAGLERLPNSLLEASGDLGGRGPSTFRHVVLPMLKPAMVAGSIFTFSLTLGDYIAAGLVGGKTQMIGRVVYDNFATNRPLAAAFATVPVVIMVGYLLGVRRTGAFESL